MPGADDTHILDALLARLAAAHGRVELVGFASGRWHVIAGGRTWRGASPTDAVRAALAALP